MGKYPLQQSWYPHNNPDVFSVKTLQKAVLKKDMTSVHTRGTICTTRFGAKTTFFFIHLIVEMLPLSLLYLETAKVSTQISIQLLLSKQPPLIKLKKKFPSRNSYNFL